MRHTPVLVQPILEALIQPFLTLPMNVDARWLVDCTLGGGGHCEAFLEVFAQNPRLRQHRILAFDQDVEAIERGKKKFEKAIQAQQLVLCHARFGDAAPWLVDRPVLGLLADLGFSSDQLEDAQRGLSFQKEGPLDMRLDPSTGTPCDELLRTLSEQALERILREQGEERFSSRIASALVRARQAGRLPKTTTELARFIVQAIPAVARHGRIHAATRSFQALRIEVNQEMRELDRLLNQVIFNLRPGGRVAILSFHSLEDRRVKHALKDSNFFKVLTKKPICASDDEIRANPRARSAKLRLAQRC